MPTNAQTIFQLNARAQYERQSVADSMMNEARKSARYEQAGDGLTLAILGSVTSTAQAVKATAGRMYKISAASPAGASNGVFVHVYNTAAGGVTVGTTAHRRSFFVPATETVTLDDYNAGSANVFGTAISVAATTTWNGNTGPAAADQPTVTVEYA